MREQVGIVPIGVVENDALDVADVPSEGLPSRVRVFDQYTPALEGIQVGDHMYILAEFDQADATVLRGSPGTVQQRGAFSIRSSSRPNRIGLTLSRATAIEGPLLALEWLDFSNGSPVLDLKPYNWRWECVLSARRQDRRFIERQLPLESLQRVFERPAANFHGERCDAVQRCAELSARLVHEFDVWIGDPHLRWTVRADGHVIDAIQGLTGATLGNGRLSLPDGAWRDSAEAVEVEVEAAGGGYRLRGRHSHSSWVLDRLR